MNSTKRPAIYGKEVIDKEVLVRFVVEDGKYAWFQGYVKELKDDEHRIAYKYDEKDDWGNLEEWEKDKELQWIREIEKEEIKDVIESRVLVEFPIQKKKKAWFQAKVSRMRKNTTKKGKERVEHLIVYDDGGEEWLDLWECVKGGKLQFLGTHRVPVANHAERVVTNKEADEVNSKRKHNSDPIISSLTLTSAANQRPKKIKEEDEDEDEAQVPADWTNEMEQWLMQTRKRQEEMNHRIMEQVRKLASGTGFRCQSWDIDRVAFLGTKVTLSCPLPRLLEQAKSLREEFGMDGELDLIVPLEQMMCYKKSLLDSVDWNV